MNQPANLPPPPPPRLPGHSAECALPPAANASSIGYTGIRYYPAPPSASQQEERDTAEAGR